jgi:hypothetical protein
MASKLSWGQIDPAHLIEWLDAVSSRDGTIVFMFGGYGHYYKVSWKMEGVTGYATAETARGLVHAVNTKLLGIRTDA